MSFDKLTEAGKAEMSERVLEGIRRGEYEMNDLPESVQEPTREYAWEKAGKEQDASSEKLPEYLDTQKEEERSSSSSNKKETAEQGDIEKEKDIEIHHQNDDADLLAGFSEVEEASMPEIPKVNSPSPGRTL